ncbi:MAG TPA: formate dehydrogenase subunit delta [Burkholderiaceae bacterium]|jgi:formate dehydrogenase subunit delta|nr:formate dehydrogenase subunit delta [Burkholderiaceae bacterium]
MDMDNLVKMANQIGDFYASYPNQVEAADEIAGHLKKFWAPRMRTQLLDYIDSQRGAGLNEIVLNSISGHRKALQP